MPDRTSSVLGLILYEMASGKRALQRGSSIEVMNSILKDDPPELPPASPPALDRIVRRCCIEKHRRAGSSSAVRSRFSHWESIAGTTQGLTPAAPSPRTSLAIPRRCRGGSVRGGGGSYWLGHYWSVGDRATVPSATSADTSILRQLTWGPRVHG